MSTLRYVPNEIVNYNFFFNKLKMKRLQDNNKKKCENETEKTRKLMNLRKNGRKRVNVMLFIF